MRNYNSSFLRTDEISREPKKVAHWLESFAEKMAIQEQAEKTTLEKTASKTAVEVARYRNENQPSIYEMMSSIISGKKPKFSSVEEAVKDYQERTGLAAFQRRNSMSDIAEQIVNAGDCEDDADCRYQAASTPGQMSTGNDYDTNNSDEEINDGVPNLHRHVEDVEVDDEEPLSEEEEEELEEAEEEAEEDDDEFEENPDTGILSKLLSKLQNKDFASDAVGLFENHEKKATDLNSVLGTFLKKKV